MYVYIYKSLQQIKKKKKLNPSQFFNINLLIIIYIMTHLHI